MRRDEFNTWWADFKTRWPGRVLELRQDRLENRDRTEDEQRNMLRLWAEALDDVELSEALEINRRWFAGELETPKWFKLEETPAFVRQHALAMRPRPTTWTGPKDAGYEERPPRYKGKPGLLRSICEDLEKGLSKEEAAERLRLAIGGCQGDQRRYNCVVCLDQGRVEIWSLYAVLQALREGIDAVNQMKSGRTSDVACYCKAGECFLNRLPRFDRDQHCQVVPIAGASGRECNPEALAELAEWVYGFRRRLYRQAAALDPLFDQGGYEP